MPAFTSWPLDVAAALVALAALALAFRGLSRAWPEHLPWGLSPIAVPAAAVLWVMLAGGEAAAVHAAALAGLRADPFLLFDGSPSSAAGCFHLVAWPLAPVLGDAAAVRVVASLAFATSLLLAHALARALGVGAWTAMLAQAVALAAPEMREPLVTGRFASVLGTAGELAVLAHLVRRLPVLEAARDGAAACAFLFGAQVLHAGSVPVTLALVLVVSAGETLAGHRRRGRWLLGAYAIALGLAFLVRYAWAMPDFARQAAAGDVVPADWWRPDTALRAGFALSLLVTRAASGAALRVQVAALVAAALVVALAFAVPTAALAEHALAFAAAPLSCLAAGGFVGMARWLRR